MTADTAKDERPNSGDAARFDADGFWKDLIERFFYYLLKRALPELYEDADINAKPRFLDKEFWDILNTADPEIHAAPHFADYVLEVPMKDGGNEWVILHIEIQGSGGGDLSVRMYHYKCLIYSHYRREPAAIAIITDKRPPKEPRRYSHNRYGTKTVYEYKNLVLAELDNNELIASDNPIDLVLYAAKFALNAKGEHQKFSFLRKAAELLDKRGWSLLDKRDLFLFTERIVRMQDKELIGQLKEFMDQRNKEGKAMYIPMFLRDSAEEIEQRGKEEGKLEVARNMLARGLSPDIISEYAGLPQEKIRELMN